MKKQSSVTVFLFSVYLLMLTWIILFKLAVSINEIIMLAGNRSINLIPFHYNNETAFHFKEVILNVLIFVPFGLFLKMMDVNTIRVIAWGAGLSLAFEICQYVFALGATDVTDFLTNTTGTILGTTLWMCLTRLIRDRKRLLKILHIAAISITLAFLCLLTLLVMAN